jgi:hypothetical protein
MLSHPELLDRVFEPAEGTFSPELARQILKVHFPASDHARYEELSAKAQEGDLSAEEQSVLDDYLNLNDFIIVLKAKAQASLKHHDSAA